MPFAKRGDVVHSEATSGFNNQKKSLLINGLAALGDSLHPLHPLAVRPSSGPALSPTAFRQDVPLRAPAPKHGASGHSTHHKLYLFDIIKQIECGLFCPRPKVLFCGADKPDVQCCVEYPTRLPTTEQGKPAARRGRKVTGLSPAKDGGTAGRFIPVAHHASVPPVGLRRYREVSRHGA